MITYLTGYNNWQWEIQMPWGSLQTIRCRNGGRWNPRPHLQLHHEVRYWHQRWPLLQHCPLRRNNHVPRNAWKNGKRDEKPSPIHNEDQNRCSTREEVLRLDRRIHPCFPLHLPTDVDLQAGVRRVWSIYCAQKMLLNCFFYFLYCISDCCRPMHFCTDLGHCTLYLWLFS